MRKSYLIPKTIISIKHIIIFLNIILICTNKYYNIEKINETPITFLENTQRRGVIYFTMLSNSFGNSFDIFEKIRGNYNFLDSLSTINFLIHSPISNLSNSVPYNPLIHIYSYITLQITPLNTHTRLSIVQYIFCIKFSLRIFSVKMPLFTNSLTDCYIIYGNHVKITFIPVFQPRIFEKEQTDISILFEKGKAYSFYNSCKLPRLPKQPSWIFLPQKSLGKHIKMMSFSHVIVLLNDSVISGNQLQLTRYLGPKHQHIFLLLPYEYS